MPDSVALPKSSRLKTSDRHQRSCRRMAKHDDTVLITCDLIDTSASINMPRFWTTRWARRDRHKNEAMTTATDEDDDWLLTRELRSSLRSTGGGSNTPSQKHDRYLLRDGSVATACDSFGTQFVCLFVCCLTAHQHYLGHVTEFIDMCYLHNTEIC